MNDHNPYRAPAGPAGSTRPAGSAASDTRWQLATALLVTIQTLLSAVYGYNSIELLRHGDISLVALLFAVLATALLIAGGVLVLRRRRSAVYLSALSAACYALALLQWYADLALTGMAIATATAVVGFLIARPKA
ncbi:hypothetical protein K4L06_04575 [Lysobacter sp. BMK333-48F3]|uniref:hypothetical protein n=1 Tax=Lysobacter sp. BMK333-48F3 TaxID=2867962 RepID=UPI001C8CBCE6|nr:hypothetical protein [Lysobacter sp. BMK333-48F3]MBX9400577.1 hypothetical protein [Lysobacter sp. BMK333-48F3]